MDLDTARKLLTGGLAKIKEWNKLLADGQPIPDLRRVSLRGADLRGINLCGANLRGVDLCGADLRDASLRVSRTSTTASFARSGAGTRALSTWRCAQSDNASVAVKMIEPVTHGSRQDLERFFREALILEQLNHPNIVAYREMGEWYGRLYFVMDYVNGVELSRLQRKNGGPLPVGRAVDIMCQVLDALDYAHAKKFVHRDIKPSNILVTADGGRDRVMVADFGLARTYQASSLSGLTGAGEVRGTVAYMAPEQFEDFRNAGPAADQYSAGATLYTLLTGQCVYGKATDRTTQVSNIRSEPLPLDALRRPDIPVGLAEVLRKSLEKNPGDRFGDVSQMRRALEPFRR